jgi:hypothetical protein
LDTDGLAEGRSASGLILAFFSGAAEAQQNARAAGKMVTLQMPAIPDPARVTIDPKTTAFTRGAKPASAKAATANGL